MQKLKNIMTRDVEVVRPEMPLFEVARKMRDLDVGVIPVCDGRKIRGMITDRDIVIRGLADRRDLRGIRARDVMSREVAWCFESDDVRRAADLMKTKQIRRLLVVNRDKDLVGIVSLGDLATETGKDRLAGETLQEVSEQAPSSSRFFLFRPQVGFFTVLSSLIGAGFYFLQRRPELRQRFLESLPRIQGLGADRGTRKPEIENRTEAA